MLTRYDEYPVHQAVSSFSEIPCTDYAWSDGYYFVFYDPSAKTEVFMSLRVHPNSDVVGAFVGITREGRQRTLRLSRRWRPNCDTVVGPLGIEFVEPFERIRLTLAENDAGLSFDVHWVATGGAVEEPHRLQVVNGRRRTDQCRYVQAGTVTGWVQLADERIVVDRDSWGALRDHSWGLYVDSPPLMPEKRWLPEPTVTRSFDAHPHLPDSRLAFYLWGAFTTETFSGALWVYEDEDGNRPERFLHPQAMPLGGAIDGRSDGVRRQLCDIEHTLSFEPGSRRVAGGAVTALDTEGGRWSLELPEIGGPPWIYWPAGVWPGAWRDGGTWATYRGAGVSEEWDEVDIRPFRVEYQSTPELPRVNAVGIPYNAKLRLTDPWGRHHDGTARLEVWFDGCYLPYGFEDESFTLVAQGPGIA